MIKLEHVKKSFGDQAILRDISLNVPTGSVTVILGPSGSGKTTLLRTINGLEPINSGQILFDGTDLAAPLMLAPVGAAALVAPDADVRIAEGAHTAGIPYVFSSQGGCPMEQTASAMAGSNGRRRA